MIGNNEIRFNQATMKEAVQEYLSKRAMPCGQVEVTNVKRLDSEFIISVKGPEAGDASKSQS